MYVRKQERQVVLNKRLVHVIVLSFVLKKRVKNMFTKDSLFDHLFVLCPCSDRQL